MNDSFPFILAGSGVMCVARGAIELILAPAARRRTGDDAADARAAVRHRRADGLFWCIVGVAALRLVDARRSWILASVALLWAVAGARGFLATFRRSGRDAVAAAAGRRGGTRLRGLAGAALLGLGAALVYASGVRVGATPSAGDAPAGGGRLAEIVAKHAGRAFEDSAHVGLVIGAVADGEEVLRGFGARGLGDARPLDADTVFEIGSISKVFTGILLARRVEAGELSLDDRVADLLPEGWSLSGPARAITLRHCTTHTSGLPRLPRNLMTPTRAFRLLLGGDPYRDYGEGAFRDALATTGLDFAPGSDHAYSNFAVGLLGFALAARDGTDYETLVRQEIAGPLGMTRTTTVDDAWTREHLSAKYRSALKLGPAMLASASDEWRLPNHLAGAGAVRSTGRDMLTFLKANMGLVATPIDAALRRSHREVFREDADRAMGMNWVRSHERDLSQDVVWHNGGTGGFRSYLGFTEDRRFGVFMLSNVAIGVDDAARGLLKAMVREYAPEARKPVTARGYARVSPFTGVRWEGDRPVVRVRGRWAPLASIDGLPIADVMEFARREFGDKARKRLAEDLVELLSKMGREPGWDVALGLEADGGRVEVLTEPMTEENRALLRGF